MNNLDKIPDRIIKELADDRGDYIYKRQVVSRHEPYVLFAQKVSFPNDIYTSPRVKWEGVGYLIDKNGNITRNVEDAFVFYLENIIDIQESDKYGKSEYEHWDYSNKIGVFKNGLYIRTIKYKDAQKFLNDHPLPRKGISKMVRGDVYSRFNGRCAYCGCELELKDMQVDHFIAHMGEGGEDTLDNYYPACQVCNRVKTNYSIEQFKKAIRHCGEIHRKRKKPIMADSDKIAIKYDLTKEDHEITLFYEKYEKEPKVDVQKIKEML